MLLTTLTLGVALAAPPALPRAQRAGPVTVTVGPPKRRSRLRRALPYLAAFGASFALTYAGRASRPRPPSGPRPIIITPGRTTIVWQPCADPTCGGVFTLAPAPAP